MEEESEWWSDGVRPFEEDLEVPPPLMPRADDSEEDEPPALSDTKSDSEDEGDDDDRDHRQAPRTTIKFTPTMKSIGKGRSSCRREASYSEENGSDSDSSQEDDERREWTTRQINTPLSSGWGSTREVSTQDNTQRQSGWESTSRWSASPAITHWSLFLQHPKVEAEIRFCAGHWRRASGPGSRPGVGSPKG